MVSIPFVSRDHLPIDLTRRVGVMSCTEVGQRH